MTGSFLATMAWPDVSGAPTILIPLGSFEQHGPHLPLTTDTAIATAVCNQVAECLNMRQGNPPVLVAAAVTYGASGEHQSFPGTVSIGQEALATMLIELVRSLSSWAGRLIVVNAHGGNIRALVNAVCQMRTEGHDLAWVACATEDVDAHAGFTETSLMLHLDPQSVRLERAVIGNVEPIALILDDIIRGGVGAVSPSGVLGDPTNASATEGIRVLQAMTDDVLDRIDTNTPDLHGLLQTQPPKADQS